MQLLNTLFIDSSYKDISPEKALGKGLSRRNIYEITTGSKTKVKNSNVEIVTSPSQRDFLFRKKEPPYPHNWRYSHTTALVLVAATSSSTRQMTAASQKSFLQRKTNRPQTT